MATIDVLATMANHAHQLVVQEPSQYSLVGQLLLANSILNGEPIDMDYKYFASR